MNKNYYTLDDFYLRTNISFAELKEIESSVRILYLGSVPKNEEGLTELFFEIHILTSQELSEEVQLNLKKLKTIVSSINYVESFDV